MRLKSAIKGRAKENQRTSTGGSNPQLVQKSAEPVKTRDEVAKLAGVSHDTIDKTEKILEKGTPEQVTRARQGGNGNSVSAVMSSVPSRFHINP